MALFLKGMGLAINEYSHGDLDIIRKKSGQYILQILPADWPLMLDLPLGPSFCVFVHRSGESLGPLDPRWALLKKWLDFLHTPYGARPDGRPRRT